MTESKRSLDAAGGEMISCAVDSRSSLPAARLKCVVSVINSVETLESPVLDLEEHTTMESNPVLEFTCRRNSVDDVV